MVSFMPQPLYPQEKSPNYPLDRRLTATEKCIKNIFEVKELNLFQRDVI
jgi:hypothetical protein